MSSLLCLIALLASATAPAALEDLKIEAEEGEAKVRIALSGAPSFSTTEKPGVFIVDFMGVEGLLPEVEEPGAPGLLAIRSERMPEGARLSFVLEAWARAEPRLEEGSLEIRILAREEDPAEAMDTAMSDLASQVARIGAGMRELRASAGEEEEEPLGISLVDAEEGEEEVAPAAEPLAEAEAATQPTAEQHAEADPVPTPTEAPVVEEAAPSQVSKAPPARVETPSAPAAQAVSHTLATVSAELVRLGFRGSAGTATVLVALEGESAHRMEQRDGLAILELSGTRVRRANDKRPLDTSFFGTPVKSIRAVEDRAAGVTRIEIELLRPAEISVERVESEIVIALAEAAQGA